MDFNGTVEKIITNGEPGSLEIWTLALVPPAWRKNPIFSHQRFLIRLNQNLFGPDSLDFMFVNGCSRSTHSKLGFAGLTQVLIRESLTISPTSLERHAELDGIRQTPIGFIFETCSLIGIPNIIFK